MRWLLHIESVGGDLAVEEDMHIHSYLFDLGYPVSEEAAKTLDGLGQWGWAGGRGVLQSGSFVSIFGAEQQ